MSTTVDSMQAEAAEFQQRYTAVTEMIGRAIVGHEEIVHGVMTAILCGGHCLLEGVPGLGKTMLVRTLSQVLDLQFSRVQFTPDLMPADILGTNMIVEDESGRRKFEFQKGPVFTQILLADEINRATPKTQSAMLETMQEGTVTAAGNRYVLDQPFFVLATQNPIEQEGTYPLPEAQMDRFLFKLVVGYSNREDLNVIVDRTTRGESPTLEKVMDGVEIQRWQSRVRNVILAPTRSGLSGASDSGDASRRTTQRRCNEPIRSLGQQSTRCANPCVGIESSRSARRSIQCVLRRHPARVLARDAASYLVEL